MCDGMYDRFIFSLEVPDEMLMANSPHFFALGVPRLASTPTPFFTGAGSRGRDLADQDGEPMKQPQRLRWNLTNVEAIDTSCCL